MYGPKWPYLLGYGSRDTRRIDFSRVDGSSTDTPILGRHMLAPKKPKYGCCPADALKNPDMVADQLAPKKIPYMVVVLLAP